MAAALDAERETENRSAELARRYFRNGYSCSEAILKAFNEIYELELPTGAHTIATGFGAGLGEAGCACGSLTAGVMALGLLSGREKVYESNRSVFQATKELHDRFRKKHKAACCRILTKDVVWDSAEHKALCETYVFDSALFTDEIIRTRLAWAKRPAGNPETPREETK
ncbi:MAG: C-GCAxxG-C-C family protein [Clostridiales Family XIII bacterium]|nr:C-GCAxxG-C-C family protein [Clostridiales Family XIII bacterium]